MAKEFSLVSMKKTLVDYATIIGEVFKCDLEIVDSDYNRVIGTGSLTGAAPIMGDGLAYREALNLSKYVVIQTPRKHAVCSRCQGQNRCLLAMEIAYPLFYKNEPMGFVGLVCVNFSQKNHVMSNIGSNLNLLRVTATLISKEAAAFESAFLAGQYLDIYRDVFRNSSECVVLVNTDGTVADMNDNAKQAYGERDFSGASIEISERDGFVLVQIGGFDGIFTGYSEKPSVLGLKILVLHSEEGNNGIRRLEDLELREILRAVEICGNTTQGKKLAAEKLGIGTATLYRRLEAAKVSKKEQ